MHKELYDNISSTILSFDALLPIIVLQKLNNYREKLNFSLIIGTTEIKRKKIGNKGSH